MVKGHSEEYDSREALTGTRNSSMNLPWGIDPTTYCTISGRSTMELHLACDEMVEVSIISSE